MAIDSREVGLRVGASANQASAIAAQLVSNGQLPDDPTTIATYVGLLAAELLVVMNDLQAGELLAAGGIATTQVAVAAPQRVTVPLPVATSAPVDVGTSPHTPSGSARPIKLANATATDNVPAWLLAQAKAKGVSEVWDNRGKPNYIAAVASGNPKTPPPFRSATDGNDTSFWPPK